MIRVLGEAGFAVEALHELRAPEGATTTPVRLRRRRVVAELALRGDLDAPQCGSQASLSATSARTLSGSSPAATSASVVLSSTPRSAARTATQTSRSGSEAPVKLSVSGRGAADAGERAVDRAGSRRRA